jgi:hypothetical protein
MDRHETHGGNDEKEKTKGAKEARLLKMLRGNIPVGETLRVQLL